jgi:hypothetical protein
LRTYASCPSLLARWRASSQPQCAALAAKFRHNSAKPNPSPPKREGQALFRGRREQEATAKTLESRGEAARLDASAAGRGGGSSELTGHRRRRRHTSRRRRREISRPSAGTCAGGAVRGANPRAPPSSGAVQAARRGEAGYRARGFSFLRLCLSSVFARPCRLVWALFAGRLESPSGAHCKPRCRVSRYG